MYIVCEGFLSDSVSMECVLRLASRRGSVSSSL